MVKNLALIFLVFFHTGLAWANDECVTVILGDTPAAFFRSTENWREVVRILMRKDFGKKKSEVKIPFASIRRDGGHPGDFANFQNELLQKAPGWIYTAFLMRLANRLGDYGGRQTVTPAVFEAILNRQLVYAEINYAVTTSLYSAADFQIKKQWATADAHDDDFAIMLVSALDAVERQLGEKSPAKVCQENARRHGIGSQSVPDGWLFPMPVKVEGRVFNGIFKIEKNPFARPWQPGDGFLAIDRMGEDEVLDAISPYRYFFGIESAGIPSTPIGYIVRVPKEVRKETLVDIDNIRAAIEEVFGELPASRIP
jgi:hypothetical protein